MEKLQALIQQYGRWSKLEESIGRIYYRIDAGLLDEAIGASKSLLETVCKTILDWEKIPYNEKKDDINDLAKKTVRQFNFEQTKIMVEFTNNLTSAIKSVGALRNSFDSHAHGKSLSTQPPKIDSITVSFLVCSTEVFACFLIEAYERQNPRISEPQQILFEDCPDFNDHLDNTYGLVHVINIPYPTSEVLFAIDQAAYKDAYNDYLGISNEQVD